MAIRIFFCIFLLTIPAIALGDALPNAGRNTYVKHGGSCLAILEAGSFPATSQAAAAPMDTFLENPTNANEAWLGLVDCDQFFQAYPINQKTFYNQRMAIWWRSSLETESGGRLRSWVQPYACLDVPNPANTSVWLYSCPSGAGLHKNFLTYDSATGRIVNGDGQCLAPSGSAVSWPTVTGAGLASLEVTAVLPKACDTETLGTTRWEFVAPNVVTYPFPENIGTTDTAYSVFVSGSGWGESSYGYQFEENLGNSGYLYSFYTPFSVNGQAFPVTIEIYSNKSVSTENGAVSLMSLEHGDMIDFDSVSYPTNAGVQFEVKKPGIVTVVFTNAPKERLALFIDPLDTSKVNLHGCSPSGTCTDGSHFVGPGLYSQPSPTCSVLGSLTASPVDLHLAGGAEIQCRVSANPGSGRVSVAGHGQSNGLPFLNAGTSCPSQNAPAPLLLACADSVVVTGVTIANTPTRCLGNLAANSPWDCAMGAYTDGQVTVDRVKQIAGFEPAADGFDIGSHSAVSNSFIEANDDSIKLIGSHQTFENMTVWQNPNGWAIDCGWGDAPDHSDIHVTNVAIPLIDHWYDHYCCGRSCPASDPSNCTCNDPTGKVSIIGCMTGDRENVDYSGLHISDVTVFRPKTPNGTDINHVQRAFAIGVTETGYGGLCPTAATLSDYHLENIYLPPAAESSRLYVNSGGTAGIDDVSVLGLYVCDDPVTGTGCNEVEKTDVAIHGNVTNVTVPEPGPTATAVVALIFIVALHSARRVI